MNDSEQLKIMIAARLKKAREESGLSQADLADYLGIQQNSYSQIETGRNSLRVEHLVKLPQILDKPIFYFLGLPPDQSLTSSEIELLTSYRAIPSLPIKQYLLKMLAMTAYLEAALADNDQAKDDDDTKLLVGLSETLKTFTSEEREIILLNLREYAIRKRDNNHS